MRTKTKRYRSVITGSTLIALSLHFKRLTAEITRIRAAREDLTEADAAAACAAVLWRMTAP